MLPYFLALSLLARLGAAVYTPSPSPTDPSDFAPTTFDFIVIGGGTSGLVVANRLSENPNIKVGVIEAGQYRPGDPLILVPESTGAALLGANSDTQTNLQGNPNYDWMFLSTAQPGLNGNPIRYPRGKVVGGSSAINSMIWQRGSATEYDLWGKTFGNGDDWTFSSLLPLFKKVETWSPPPIVIPGQHSSPDLALAHGTNGSLKTGYNNFMTDIEVPAVVSANQLGIPTSSNPDGGKNTGIAYSAHTVDPATGQRSYAEVAYYEPSSTRSNLKLLSEALVTRVIIDKSTLTATAVEYRVNNTTFIAQATKEVILAAGSIQTPHLLELSGIGNKTILSALGITTLVDAPSVGENLQDHPVSISDFQMKTGTVSLDTLTYNATFAAQAVDAYKLNGSGPLSYTDSIMAPTPIQPLVNSSQLSDLLILLASSLHSIKPRSGLHAAQLAASKKLITEGQTAWIELVLVPQGGIISVPQPNVSYTTAAVMLLHPLSRGSVHIASTDPTVPPVINPHYFDVPFDAQVLVRATQFAQKWISAANSTQSLTTPNSTVHTDTDWDTYVRGHTGSTNHPLGTAAMAPKEMGGVVSNRLKVYGVKNLRVVDASIFPFTISAPLVQTVYGVAEKAASMIKEDHNI